MTTRTGNLQRVSVIYSYMYTEKQEEINHQELHETSIFVCTLFLRRRNG